MSRSSLDRRIVAQVERHPRITVPEIARRLEVRPMALAGRLPQIIEREGWDRGRLNLYRQRSIVA